MAELKLSSECFVKAITALGGGGVTELPSNPTGAGFVLVGSVGHRESDPTQKVNLRHLIAARRFSCELHDTHYRVGGGGGGADRGLF